MDPDQTKILAFAVYQLKLLLAGHLGQHAPERLSQTK